MSSLAVVTGAGGFIGSHLTERLLSQGLRVRALVHYNSRSHPGFLAERSAENRDLEIVFGDVTDHHQMRDLLAGADVVCHLAALIGIPYSYAAPRSYVATNVEGTLNLLLAARDAGVGRFVHTSTSEVYGTAQALPIAEDHPLRAQSPYAASKIAADQLVESFHLSFGLPTVIVRPFNTYGPRQSARAVIPTIIRQALAGPVVRLGATDTVRDLTFVTDTVRGLAAAAGAEGAVGATIHLGNGVGWSIAQVAQAIFDLLGGEFRIETDERRLRPQGSEVRELVCDRSLASQLLDWRPEVPLAEGLRETIDWMRSHREDHQARGYLR